MKIAFLLSFFAGLAVSISALGQTFNGTTNNSWNLGSNWDIGSVPSGTGTDVTIASGVSVSGGISAVIGNITVNNTKSIAVPSSNTLTIGSAALFNATPTQVKTNLTYSNNGSLTVGGTLYVYGDLIVNNKLTLVLTGNMVVFGNVSFMNGGTLTVSGSGNLQVGGNFDAGNGTNISVAAGTTINVGGNITIGGGGGSSITGLGTITTGGTCKLGGGSCGSIVTPVTLLFFNSSETKTNILLRWSTASEMNFDYFNLEKSVDGIAFNSIANVKGHGTTNERHDYSYEDNFPLIGRNYYRLTSVDLDNYQEVFNVIVQDFAGKKDFQVSPNPSDGRSINLTFNFESEDGRVVIYDNLGSIVDSFQVSQAREVGFSNPLKNGIYLAKYASSSFSKTIRFMVKQ